MLLSGALYTHQPLKALKNVKPVKKKSKNLTS